MLETSCTSTLHNISLRLWNPALICNPEEKESNAETENRKRINARWLAERWKQSHEHMRNSVPIFDVLWAFRVDLEVKRLLWALLTCVRGIPEESQWSSCRSRTEDHWARSHSRGRSSEDRAYGVAAWRPERESRRESRETSRELGGGARFCETDLSNGAERSKRIDGPGKPESVWAGPSSSEGVNLLNHVPAPPPPPRGPVCPPGPGWGNIDSRARYEARAREVP